MDALVLGTSIIDDLGMHCWMGNGYLQRELGLQTFGINVEFCGLRGAKIPRIQAELPAVFAHRYFQCVFIQAGGNDLCCEGPEVVATRLFELAEVLVNSYWVQHVFIGQILRRNSPWYISYEEYDSRLRVANYMLESLGDGSNGPITYFRHRHMWNRQRNIFRGDGTHLNQDGEEILFFSLRRAISLCSI